MVTTPVASTLIKALHYDCDQKLLQVEFHNEKRVSIAPVSADEYVAFLSAESKGKYFHKHIAPRLKGGPAPGPSNIIDTHIDLKEPLPIGPLEVFHHDDCCTQRLQKASRETLQTWECPNCGTLWEKVQRGEIFNWEPRPAFFLVRSRRG